MKKSLAKELLEKKLVPFIPVTGDYWFYMQWAASRILTEPLPTWHEWQSWEEGDQLEFLEYNAAHPYENLDGEFIRDEIQNLCDDVLILVQEQIRLKEKSQ